MEWREFFLDDDNNIQNDAIVGSPDEPYFWPRPGLSNSSLVRGGDRIWPSSLPLPGPPALNA